MEKGCMDVARDLKTYPEIAGVENQDSTHLGFTFVARSPPWYLNPCLFRIQKYTEYFEIEAASFGDAAANLAWRNSMNGPRL